MFVSYAASRSELSDRFGMILDGVCRAVAARMVKDRPVSAVLWLVWSRLRRSIVRFARLSSEAPRLARAPAASGPRVRDVSAEVRLRLPRGYAWLLPMVPGVAGFGSQLRHLLDDPQMLELLRENPSIGRMLRPLCQMLAVIPGEVVAMAGRARRGSVAVAAPDDGSTAAAGLTRAAGTKVVERSVDGGLDADPVAFQFKPC